MIDGVCIGLGKKRKFVYSVACFPPLRLPHRPEKIASVIRASVAAYAQQIPPATASIVSVVEVVVSDDFSYADIALSALSGVDDAILLLRRRASSIRAELATKLRLFRVPQLRFHRDEDGERAQRVEDLLKRIAVPQAASSSSPKRTRKKSTSS